MSGVTVKQHHIPVSQDESAAVCQFVPSSPRATVIIAPAMGTTQQYYRPLAEWLAGNGYQVFTFDYRGMGLSRTKPLTHYQSSITDWVKDECKHILSFAGSQSEGLKVFWVGHSLGGQVFPLIDGIERVSKVITFASGTGYWKRNAPQLRKKVWWFWFVMVPLLLPLYGYFPGKKLGMVGDLPRNVMSQWRKWCMHPEYCVGVEDASVRARFDAISVPIRAYALADDEMLSARNISDLFGMFGSDDKQLQTLSPQDYDLSRIGHLGYFRKEGADRLWRETLLPELN